MDEYKGLSHSKWECKYHVMFIPKCRRKTLCGQLRKYLGGVFMNWRGERNAGLKRVIRWLFMYTCCQHSAKICGIASGRLYQGQERHPDS